MHLVSTRLPRSGKQHADNYTQKNLTGGKDLKGEDLHICIQDALQPFLLEEATKKMAPVGSSQQNECLNSVIGSKAQNIRHYRGLESGDSWAEAGVAH